jgi:hypothetical protein
MRLRGARVIAYGVPGEHTRQQALGQRNRPVAPALSEVPGPPGPRRRRALVAGERAPSPRAAVRHARGHKARDDIARALPGPWREAPRFGLQPALALCACDPAPLRAGAAQIARTVSSMQPPVAPAPHAPVPPRPLPPPRPPPAHSTQAPASRATLRVLAGASPRPRRHRPHDGPHRVSQAPRAPPIPCARGCRVSQALP